MPFQLEYESPLPPPAEITFSETDAICELVYPKFPSWPSWLCAGMFAVISLLAVPLFLKTFAVVQSLRTVLGADLPQAFMVKMFINPVVTLAIGVAGNAVFVRLAKSHDRLSPCRVRCSSEGLWYARLAGWKLKWKAIHSKDISNVSVRLLRDFVGRRSVPVLEFQSSTRVLCRFRLKQRDPVLNARIVAGLRRVLSLPAQ